MLQARASEREQIDQFLAALRSLPEVQAELESAGAPALDVPVAMDVAGKPIHALVELRKAVYPRDVRLLIWRIRDLARQQPAGDSGGEPLAVLVAESISPGLRSCFERSGSGTSTAAAASTCRPGDPTSTSIGRGPSRCPAPCGFFIEFAPSCAPPPSPR